MNHAELLTRGTVWLALGLYVAGEVAQRKNPFGRRARWLNTVGFVFFVAHVATAFHFYHGWNHAAAYAATAQETEKLFGWRSGAGLYVNYAFLAVWAGWTARAWTRPTSAPPRTRRVWAVRGFFAFMMFNGAVVFAHGAMKAAGLAMCAMLIACWWSADKPNRRITPRSPGSTSEEVSR